MLLEHLRVVAIPKALSSAVEPSISVNMNATVPVGRDRGEPRTITARFYAAKPPAAYRASGG